MNITEYFVTKIHSKGSIHIFGHKAQIIDEGDFYRIAGTYIIDKFRITGTEIERSKLTIHLKNNEDYILTVEKRKK